jgi:hypothetical protein
MRKRKIFQLQNGKYSK